MRPRLSRGGERIHRGVRLHVLHDGGNVAPLDEGAQNDEVAVGAGFRYEIALALWRKRAGVARRHHEVFAALALVGPRQPEVGDEAEVGIIENAQRAGRHLQDHRSVLHVDDPPGIDHDRVRGQEERAGVRQALGDAEAFVGREAAFDKAPSQGLDRGSRHAQQEGFHTANEVEVVVDLLHGVGVGQAVAELERADPGLHRVGRRNRRRHFGGIFGRGHGRSFRRSRCRGRFGGRRRLLARHRGGQRRYCHESRHAVHCLLLRLKQPPNLMPITGRCATRVTPICPHASVHRARG